MEGGLGQEEVDDAEALDRLEFYAVIDFFLSETAFHADVVLPGSLHEEDEGTSTSARGRVIKINAAVDPPGDARLDWEILCDIAAPTRARRRTSRTRTPSEIFDELRVASQGGTADYAGITWERIEDEMGVFWPCPDEGHPGHPTPVRGRPVHHRRRPGPVPRRCAYRPPAEVVDDDYPIWLTTGRVVSQYLSGTQTRRIGPLVAQYPEPLCEMHPRLAEQHWASPTATSSRVTSRRGSITLPAARGDHDPARHGVHPVPLARRQGRQPAHQPRRSTRCRRSPSSRCRAVRVERAGGAGESHVDRCVRDLRRLRRDERSMA